MEIKTTMRVDRIQQVKTRTKNTDKQIYVLRGKDSDGVGTIQIKLTNNFDGINPEEIVDITIRQSQKSITDFEQESKIKKNKE